MATGGDSLLATGSGCQWLGVENWCVEYFESLVHRHLEACGNALHFGVQKESFLACKNFRSSEEFF